MGGGSRAIDGLLASGHLAWLRTRGIVPRTAGPGIESGERLGQRRWKIERSIAWLFGYRRLTVPYERKGSHFLAFLGLYTDLTATRISRDSPRETRSKTSSKTSRDLTEESTPPWRIDTNMPAATV
ncbi:hypothetical protein ACIQZB_42350 [Streptomyces sp. NPDC097727]|uniref:hypothetical protein n=1 Tax=Streptomyces sp. NPDC097727 TaxID=3366092 RepID=UPI00382F35E8